MKNSCLFGRLIQLFVLLCFQLNCPLEAKLSHSLFRIAESDTVVKVWVVFTDKPERPSGRLVSSKAEKRRRNINYIQSGDADYPVASGYLRQIQKCGAVLHHVYKWENCASFYVNASKLNEIASLSIVKKIEPVRSYNAKYIDSKNGLFKSEIPDNMYGTSFGQLDLINIPAAHDYLSRFRNVTTPGDGVMVAVFDGGFRFGHNCFSYLRKNKNIKASWDFIDNDSTVYDHDSVYNNPDSRYYQNDEHGSTVLSLISGYDPGSFLGTAWGADLVLARTENGIYDGELHYEEDNWFSALVWAESLGVDIVSSSLGYRTDFVDSVTISRFGDSVSVKDYEYSDLDGKTTIVSRAALYAIERGMIIVNAIGNEGADTLGTLSAPADVDGVISVGAVNSSGSIAYFSSTGPTSDGRIKPDLVCQGVGITIPSIYGGVSSYSSFAQGTSFSTPIIAGVCALIMQSFKGITADNIRERLYKYCKLLNENSAADNYSGRGLPDALLSCMRDDEVYVTVKDSIGRPLQFALISDENGDSIGITDKDGISLLSIKPENLPQTASLSISGLREQMIISSTPARKDMILPLNGGLLVKLIDQKSAAIHHGNIYFKIPGVNDNFIQGTTDSLGVAHLNMYKDVSVQIYAKAKGFYSSDTIDAQIGQELCTLTVQLNAIPAEKFNLYPNIVKKSRGRILYIEFFPESEEKSVQLSIRTLDGAIVWKKSLLPNSMEGLKIKLDSELNRMAPGLYYFILENNRKVYRRKFLIAG